MPIPYNKPALTFAQQLQQLKDRNLIIEDDDKALFLLENVSYYRLSGYWYPLLSSPKSAHIFKPGSTFNQAFNLYCFDRELRKLISAELEKIEVSIRAKMIYVLSHQYGPFWFLQPKLFLNGSRLTNTLDKLTNEFNRSRDDFILSFKQKYADPLPPSWMIFEISSFGILSNLYENLRPGLAKREIAGYYGLDSKTFTSWMHSIVYIRNVCAHHSRLWNRRLSITPIIPNNPANQWLNIIIKENTATGEISTVNNKTYYFMSMLIYLLNTIRPKHKFRNKLHDLLEEYSNVDPAAMGFTLSWQDEPLWKV